MLPINVQLCDDVMKEIVSHCSDCDILTIASISKRNRAIALNYYNTLPVVKLSSIHNLFVNLIPANIIQLTNSHRSITLIAQNDIQAFLRGLRDSDYGIWCVLKDQLQFIGNHQLVKYGRDGCIYTIFRCLHCRKLTDNALYHPWVHYNDDNTITIESHICCRYCVGEMDRFWRDTLTNYIINKNIINPMIVHHEHVEPQIGHCVYRLRNQEYNDNMVLNDAEVFARVIIESGVATTECSIKI